jgi:hypothetical protein
MEVETAVERKAAAPTPDKPVEANAKAEMLRAAK